MSNQGLSKLNGITEQIVGWDELTDNQQTFIVATVLVKTLNEAARKAGVTVTTVYNWYKNSQFLNAKKQFRKIYFDAILNRTIVMTADAIEFYHTILTKEIEKTSDRLRAGENIVAFAQKGMDAEQLQERVELLEAMLNEIMEDKDDA